MPEFTLIPARAYHCGIMARRVRAKHLAAMLKMGQNPHMELRARFYESTFAQTWLVDGQIAAMGGVTGGVASSTGTVWLAVSELAARYPVAMVREARRQIELLMVTKQELHSALMSDDDASRRFAVFLGFGGAETKAGRRTVLELFDDPDLRIPIGAGFMVPISYQKETC